MAVQAPTRTGFTWRSASATSTGNVRSHNEDALLERPDVGLWVVADGMGGHNAGDVASNMIVQSLSGLTRRASPSAQLDEVEDRLREVNTELYQASLHSQAGMSGSTIVAHFLRLTVVHGDLLDGAIAAAVDAAVARPDAQAVALQREQRDDRAATHSGLAVQ